jgi:hypothetical protein
MGLLATWARGRLLGRCDAHAAALRGREDGNDGSTEQIREGLRAAEAVLQRIEPVGSLRTYLETVDAELLREMGRLDSPREDDRTTAGVATIRSEVQRIPGRLLRRCLTLLLIAGILIGLFYFVARDSRL